ncbi:hypothetical protein LCGC14_0839830 [marine sediment metagenome]|uniref:Uncharacterized protein n=1 Tax=marine sediment metagenome TaxID=412755 RepID=A0A0F9PI57_9ZZZZ
MATIINHDIRSVNGKYLIMPPWKEGQSGWGNLSVPNVCAAGGDTAQQYPVNAKFVNFDRRFIYGYCTAVYTTNKANVGMFNGAVKELVTFGSIAGAAGDTLVSIDGTTLDVETTAAANVFAGGYFMPRTNPYSDYRIISNTTYIGGSVSATEMDIVIEDGLTEAVTAAQASCFLDKNPYQMLVQNWAGGRDYESVVGVTLIDPTVSTWQWIQVSGPVHVPSDENMGASANLRCAWWHIDGSVRAGAGYDETTSQQQQYAGYCIGDTTSSDVMSWFIMLNPLD